jgi:tetratricopeptide (TPR) repeat protein
MKRILPLLGLAVLATLLGFWGLRMLKGEKERDFVQEYFKPYPVPMSAPLDKSLQHWLSGLVNYRDNSFANAELEWTASLDAREMPPFMLRFYIAQAQIAQGKYAEAAGHLNRVLQNRNDIHPVARWYLGLALLGAKDEERAIAHFQIISEEQSYRHQDAADILAVIHP